MLHEQNGVFNKVVETIRSYYKKMESQIKANNKKINIHYSNKSEQVCTVKKNPIISCKSTPRSNMNTETKIKQRTIDVRKINKNNNPSFLNQI